MSGISPLARRTPPTDVPAAEAARPPSESKAAAKPPLSQAEAEQTVTTLNRVLNPLDLHVHIHYDDENRRYGFKIVDQRTNEVT